MSSTRLRKLKKGFVLNAYKKKSFLIRQRMKYFLQVNQDLHKVEEQKVLPS